MKRTNENRVMSSRPTAEKPAGSTTSEEVPGTGSTSAADGVCGTSSSSGSTAVLVKRGGGTRVIVGESNFEQLAPDAGKQFGKRVADGTDDQETKKIKPRQTPNFPIHAFATEHQLAANDSDDEQTNLETDVAWWQEVESQMDVDMKADREWWNEVEIAIQAGHESNELYPILFNASEVEVARGKRERESFRCTGVAKRLKEPG